MFFYFKKKKEEHLQKRKKIKKTCLLYQTNSTLILCTVAESTERLEYEEPPQRNNIYTIAKILSYAKN